VAFSDPQSVNPGTGAENLPRLGTGLDEGNFARADKTLVLSFQHQYKTRTRRQARLDQSKIVANPLSSTASQRVGLSAYLVVDAPQSGFTQAEILSHVTGLLSNLTTGSNANLIKFLGGES